MSEQLDIPGIIPAFFIFDELVCTVDIQSSSRSDGRVWWYMLKHAKNPPLKPMSIDNLDPRRRRRYRNITPIYDWPT